MVLKTSIITVCFILEKTEISILWHELIKNAVILGIEKREKMFCAYLEYSYDKIGWVQH